MIRTTVFLTPLQLEKLQLKKEETGLSMAEIVRRAVDRYFMMEPRRPKRVLEKTDG